MLQIAPLNLLYFVTAINITCVFSPWPSLLNWLLRLAFRFMYILVPVYKLLCYVLVRKRVYDRFGREIEQPPQRYENSEWLEVTAKIAALKASSSVVTVISSCRQHGTYIL